ncbi:MAG: hypothetical protein JW747_01320 [Candidatus Aminicenantes bacterium]|nr:hypothetical protein [Candidatus Aminicenantes bacterium]
MRKWILAALGIVVLPLFLPGWRSGSAELRNPANPVVSLVRTLEVGPPVSCGNLTFVPVYARRIADRTDYVTLEEALKTRVVEITEVDGGRVPQVKISNLSKSVLFLMAGEILSGCRQDRILAQDVLLAPGTRNLIVPVYCVEQGRWTAHSAAFTSKANLGTYRLRAKAAEQAPAAQSRIWEEVRSQNRDLGVASGTSAYQDAYDKEENKQAIGDIEKKISRELRLGDDVVGVVIGLGGRAVSVDIFANAGLFKKQWPKILKSSALSSIYENRGGELSQKAAADFLRSFAGREYGRRPALDLGYELESAEKGAMVKALVCGTAVIHLAGFPQEADRMKVVESPEPRMPVFRR